VVDERDAALTNYKPRMAEACSEDFFMVGGGAVFDDTGVEDRLRCLLPDIPGFVVTPQARGVDLVVQPLPNSNTVVLTGTFNWLGEPENLAKLSQGLRNAASPLEWVRADANHYDQTLIEVGGDAVDNVYIHSAFYPFEEAADNPATQEYLDAFAEYTPDGKDRAYLGLQAWSAWLLFAQSARDCGSDLTRKCVYDNAKSVHEWTGGGLHVATDPGTNTPSGCFTVMQATPDGFIRPDIDANDGIYRCDDAGLYELEGDYGEGATLADVGLSEADLR